MPLPPALYTVAHGWMCEAHISSILHKLLKCESCAEWCAKVHWCLLDTIVPFYAVLLASAMSCALPRPMSIVVAMVWLWPQMICAIMWLQLVRDTSAAWTVSANNSPFLTNSPSIWSDSSLTSDDRTVMHNQRKYGAWALRCPLPITWPWLSYAANLEKPAATVQFGPIIIGNGHFQSSTKLCRFAGTK